MHRPSPRKKQVEESPPKEDNLVAQNEPSDDADSAHDDRRSPVEIKSRTRLHGSRTITGARPASHTESVNG